MGRNTRRGAPPRPAASAVVTPDPNQDSDNGEVTSVNDDGVSTVDGAEGSGSDAKETSGADGQGTVAEAAAENTENADRPAAQVHSATGPMEFTPAEVSPPQELPIVPVMAVQSEVEMRVQTELLRLSERIEAYRALMDRSKVYLSADDQRKGAGILVTIFRSVVNIPHPPVFSAVLDFVARERTGLMADRYALRGAHLLTSAEQRMLSMVFTLFRLRADNESFDTMNWAAAASVTYPRDPDRIHALRDFLTTRVPQ